jgi:hypothetical protein
MRREATIEIRDDVSAVVRALMGASLPSGGDD